LSIIVMHIWICVCIHVCVYKNTLINVLYMYTHIYKWIHYLPNCPLSWCTCEYVYAYMYVSIRIHPHTYHTCIHTFINEYTTCQIVRCRDARMNMCMYTCMCVCIHVCTAYCIWSVIWSQSLNLNLFGLFSPERGKRDLEN